MGRGNERKLGGGGGGGAGGCNIRQGEDVEVFRNVKGWGWRGSGVGGGEGVAV